MIGRLRGVITDRLDDGSCVLETRGVGYEVFVPMPTITRLPDPPNEVTLYIHMQVREDAMTLYGFESVQDRATFRTLLSVNGVGPRVALSVMSALGASALGDAVGAKDIKRLRSVPGVGPKMAERIILELKDKLLASPRSLGTSINGFGMPQGGHSAVNTHGLVVQMLTQMGYKSVEAERAVGQLGKDREGLGLEELLREALRVLS